MILHPVISPKMDTVVALRILSTFLKGVQILEAGWIKFRRLFLSTASLIFSSAERCVEEAGRSVETHT